MLRHKSPVSKKEKKGQSNKPKAINLDTDFVIIRTEYDKTYQGKFVEHYYTLNYRHFNENIYTLGGTFAELLRMRKGLIGDIKLSEDEMKHARRHFMTPEIEKYRQDLIEQQEINNMLGGWESLARQLHKQRAENLAKKEREAQSKAREEKLNTRRTKRKKRPLNGK